ncbi:uncharacterized protein LOC129587087 [Paramacrobiotus metropolitanus]|uniref:uncharacterized protein LOC129587087 n=1 Tax=Paramacrobiotus metropolitanus TaxID=2943436 RepID=UPI0024460EF7|nr:uncharacterized protein LOC129587087 [Paramacrobiotus metropolitanus]
MFSFTRLQCFQTILVGIVTTLNPLDRFSTRTILPDTFLNIFANGKDKINHIRALSSIFDIPDIISLTSGNTVEFRQKKDTYEYCVTLQNAPKYEADELQFCIPFKINQRTSSHVAFRPLRVMFSFVNESLQAIIQRDTLMQNPSPCASAEAIILFTPHKAGIEVSFNGLPKAVYRPTPRWYMLGAFQIDLKSSVLDKLDIVNGSLQKISEVSSRSGFWSFQSEYDHPNEFITVFTHGPAQSGTYKSVVTAGGSLHDEIAFGNWTSTVVESTPTSTVLLSTFIMTNAYSVSRTVYEWNTVTQNITVNNDTVTLVYKRTLPWPYYGTYVETEKSATANKHSRSSQGLTCRSNVDSDPVPCNQLTPKLTISHGPNSRDILWFDEGNRNATYRFRINGSFDLLSSSGSVILGSMGLDIDGDLTFKLNASSVSESGFKKDSTIRMSMDYFSDPFPTLNVAYQEARRSVPWTRQFRRVISPLVLKKFKSAETGTSQYYTSLEIVQLSEHQFHFSSRIFYGSSFISFNFSFNTPVFMLENNHNMPGVVEYAEMDGKVIVTIYSLRDYYALGDHYALHPKREKMHEMIFEDNGVNMYHCSPVCSHGGFLVAEHD